MKKLFLFAALLCTAVALCGCSQKKAEGIQVVSGSEIEYPVRSVVSEEPKPQLSPVLGLLLDAYSNIDPRELRTQEDVENVTVLRIWLDNSGKVKENVSIRELTLFLNLQELQLWNIRIDDLDALPELPHLERLMLANCGVSDCSAIGKLENLTWLKLNGNDIADPEPLSQLKELQQLDISGNDITNLDFLAGLSNLETLNISDTPIASFEGLATLKMLERLDVSDNTFDSMDFLSGLYSLKELDISDCGIHSLEWLEQLPSLEILNISDNPLGTLTGIESAKGLMDLKLRNCRIDSIEPLAHLPKLKSLDISNSQYFEEEHNEIANFEALTSLDLLEALTISQSDVPLLASLAGKTSTRVCCADDFFGSPWMSIEEVLSKTKFKGDAVPNSSTAPPLR